MRCACALKKMTVLRSSISYYSVLCKGSVLGSERKPVKFRGDGDWTYVQYVQYCSSTLYGQQAELRVHRLQVLIPIPGIRYICIKYSIIICLNNLLSFLQQYMHRHCQSLKVNNHNRRHYYFIIRTNFFLLYNFFLQKE